MRNVPDLRHHHPGADARFLAASRGGGVRCVAIDYGGTLTDPRASPDAALGMRPITDQAAAALGGLAALGLTLVLASNTRDDQDRNRALRAAGVADLFSLVLQSHRLGVAKPGARFFGYLRHMAGCRAGELLMVGNRIELDVRPAVELGMPAVLIAPDRPSDLPAGARHLPDIALLPGLLAGGPVHG